jgi:uncharacterized protein
MITDTVTNQTIKRDIGYKLSHLAKHFPAVGLLGPRQSGKTTLVKKLFPNYFYFNFEHPDLRAEVEKNPDSFLNNYKNEAGVILDEIQRLPSLLSYIQVHIDAHKKIGHFILTGSQNILLNQSINQSLAGRIGLLTLLPLSIKELKQAKILNPNWLDTTLFQGTYPGLVSQLWPLPSVNDWYRSYINTYIERDLRHMEKIYDLATFQKFMKLCAIRVGSQFDITSLSNEAGISSNIAKQWLSVLEACYIIFFLHPYYRNIGKQVKKASKLYFYDSGLLCSLLSINSAAKLLDHYLRGHIFETFIIADFIKQRLNRGYNPDCYFWQNKYGEEVDCIIEQGSELIPIEIKVSDTVKSDFFNNLALWNQTSQTSSDKNILVYGGLKNSSHPGGKIISWENSDTLAIEEEWGILKSNSTINLF